MSTKRQELIGRLNQASQRMGNITVLFTNAIASRVGLSATEFECMGLLRDGPLPAGRLAELCGLTTGAITGLVDRLVKSGYVRRAADPADRRRVMVELQENEEMRAKISELYAPMEEAFSELTDHYPVEELVVINKYMDAANVMVERLTLVMHAEAK